MVALLLLCLFENSNSGWSERIWNLLLPPLRRLYLYYHNAYGYQTWQGGDLPWRALAHKVIWHFNQVVVGRSRDKLKSLYLPYKVSMARKLGKTGTYLEGLLPLKSHDAMITWSCEITWQTKTIISPLPQCLRPPNMAAWQLTWMGSYPYSHINLWFCGLAKSFDKLKLLNLHNHSAYGHQTCQIGGLRWWSPII